LQKKLCPVTGRRGIIAVDGFQHEDAENMLICHSADSDMKIWRTNDPVIYFLNFFLSDLELIDDYLKPNLEVVAEFGMEVSELLSEDGNKAIPRYFNKLPDNVFFWAVSLIENKSERINFIMNQKNMVLDNGKKYGDFFAQLQKEKIEKIWGKKGVNYFYKAGPLVAMHVLEYITDLSIQDINKIQKIKQDLLKIKSYSQLYNKLLENKIKTPERIMSSGVTSKFIQFVLQSLEEK